MNAINQQMYRRRELRRYSAWPIGVVAGTLVLVASLEAAPRFRLPLSSNTATHYYYDHGSTTDWKCGSETYSGHRGTDFSGGPRGRAIFAGAAGSISYKIDGYGDGYPGSPDGGGAGNYVKLAHGSGFTSYYMHMTAGSVTGKGVGASVACSEQLGGVGTSGSSSGLHLHFEPRISGVADDPYSGSCGGSLSYWVNQNGGSPVTSCGVAPDRHIVGDWDGNGTMTPGVVRKENGNLVWYLRNSNSAGDANIVFAYGLDTDVPVFGDWDGNNTFTPGVRRGNTWYLRNSNSSGANDIAAFSYGLSTDFATVGDWDGNGTMTVGVIRNNTGNWEWSLRNANSAGASAYVFNYGVYATDSPVTGDWDNNGSWTPGVYRSNTWYLRNANSSGSHSITPFSFGQPDDDAIVGDWDGNGTMTIGVVRGDVWYLRNSNSAGAHSYTFGYGQ